MPVTVDDADDENQVDDRAENSLSFLDSKAAVPGASEGARRARANLLSLDVWHKTHRFALPGVGLTTPS